MPKLIKVFAVIGGVMVLLLLLCAGGGWLWFSANKDRFLAMGKEATDDAKSFAATHDHEACVTESLDRDDACEGLMCEAKVGVFLETCLKASADTPGFCDGVPKQTEFVSGAKWIVARCTDLHAKDMQRCQRLLGSQQKFCHPSG